MSPALAQPVPPPSSFQSLDLNHSASGKVQYPSFTEDSQPRTFEDFLARAQQVAELLALDVAERDRDNVVPSRQVQLLKDAGLVTALGPIEHGGGGLSFEQGYKLQRAVSAGDGSIGQLLAYHYLWSYTAWVVGTEEQAAYEAERYTKGKYFIGGAVNPRDSDLAVSETPDGRNLVFNGRKAFSTGSKVSDLTVLEGVFEGTETHVFALAESKQPGIVYGDDWKDVLGMRGTQSGSVTITNVVVPWARALGFDPATKAFQPLGAFNTLLLPAIQNTFSNFYLGIAQGALAQAAKYTVKNTRAWPFAGDVKSTGHEEFYIQETYGELQSKLWALEAQLDRTGELIGALLSRQNRQVTDEERGQVAVRIAATKVTATEIALEVTTKIYEVLGARSIAFKASFDHFWRNVRTHTLHDPKPHKAAEVGRFVLKGELPTHTLSQSHQQGTPMDENTEPMTLQNQTSSIEPALGALPLELKALIAKAVDELDKERMIRFIEDGDDYVDEYSRLSHFKAASGDDKVNAPSPLGWRMHTNGETSSKDAQSKAHDEETNTRATKHAPPSHETIEDDEAGWVTDDRTLSSESDDEYESDDDDPSDPSSLASTTEPRFTSVLSRLALVSREWAELTRPFLWRAVSLRSDRPESDIIDFVRTVLPKHGQFIESLFIEQAIEDEEDIVGGLMEEDENHSWTEPMLEPLQDPETAAALDRVDELCRECDISVDVPKGVGPGIGTGLRYLQARSRLMACVIKRAPALKRLSMDCIALLPPAEVDQYDFAFEQARKLGNQIDELIINLSSSGLPPVIATNIQEGLASFTRLSILSLDVGLALNELNDNARSVMDQIRSMVTLKSLSLSQATYLSDADAVKPWSSSLQSLYLHNCQELSYSGLVKLLEMHGQTLQELDLDEMPNDMTDADREQIRPLNLPHVRMLAVATVFGGRFLDQWLNSPIEHFELGFAPSIGQHTIENFIAAHSSTLKKIVLTDIDQLTDAQVESLEVLCHSKNIDFVIDVDDEMDDEDEDREHYSDQYHDDYSEYDSDMWSDASE
ncbi:hypothetical protein OIO90_001955 [Microbotryomycetes sp. JL221]|nr:hypothetical protein OIO90_001955 [Microbotryomycetes sp. JL221]